jgi:hypothetical protein
MHLDNVIPVLGVEDQQPHRKQNDSSQVFEKQAPAVPGLSADRYRYDSYPAQIIACRVVALTQAEQIHKCPGFSERLSKALDTRMTIRVLVD